VTRLSELASRCDFIMHRVGGFALRSTGLWPVASGRGSFASGARRVCCHDYGQRRWCFSNCVALSALRIPLMSKTCLRACFPVLIAFSLLFILSEYGGLELYMAERGDLTPLFSTS